MASREVNILSLDDWVWREGPRLPHARFGATSVVHEGFIVVAGGLDEHFAPRQVIYMYAW